jgi:hypothetical protein
MSNFIRLRSRAGHYKMPAQQQAGCVGGNGNLDTLQLTKLIMRHFILLTFIFFAKDSIAQTNHIFQYKKYFDKDLKLWANTFTSFKLSDFAISDTLDFENIDEKSFKSYEVFLSIYKPILTYSIDSSKFIDIYSYQINLEKKGDYYYASADIDQTIFLCNPKIKYWKRIFFGTNSQWIDEVIWLTKSKFILVGITKSPDDRKLPLILLGDTKSQKFEEYLTKDERCVQTINGYQSQKVKRLNIKGL